MSFNVQQLRLFIEHTPAAVAIFDKNMKYLFLSQRWVNDYGLKGRDIIGRSHYEIFPEIPDRWKEVHKKCLAGAIERCEEDRFERADGHIDWIRWEIYPWHEVDGEIGGIIMFTEVLNEQKKIQLELQREEAKFRSILSVLPDVVLILDANGVYREVFPGSGPKHLIAPAQQLIGKSIHEILPPDKAKPIQDVIDRVIGTQKLEEFDYSLSIHEQQQWFSAKVVRFDINESPCVLWLARNITERKLLEQKSISEYKRNDLYQSAIIKIATAESVIRGDFRESLEAITAISAQALDVERVGIWLLSGNHEELRCVNLYEKNSDSHANGMTLFAKDYPKYFQAIATGRAVDAHDALQDPRTKEFAEIYLKPLKIASMLDAAVRVSGEIVGIVCHEHIGEKRMWTPQETTFASEIADQVAHVILNSERRSALEELHKAHAQLEIRVKERTSELTVENTERRKAQDALKISEDELRQQKIALEQKNLALKEILEQIEVEKRQIKNDVISNAEELLLPTLKKLKRKGAKVDKEYIKLLEDNIQNLVSSFGGKISQKQWKLTPREIEICNMIKNGLSSKEVSDLLNVSCRTIEIHRNNIRRKLGLSHKDVNLSSYLQSL